MPICANCNSYFPNRTMIGGREKNLGGRKYCLECSPWGEHNTKPIITPLKNRNPGTHTCHTCKRELPLSGFYLMGNGRPHSPCKDCRSNRYKEGVSTKQLLVEHLGGRCVICQYNRCIDALVFHHRDPKEKDFSLSSHRSRSFENLKIETAKCVLLCVNCHREIHCGVAELPLGV